jgi:hypothetical protein
LVTAEQAFPAPAVALPVTVPQPAAGFPRAADPPDTSPPLQVVYCVWLC